MRRKDLEFSSKVGKKVKQEREKRGLSQEKLAELADISVGHVGNIERASSSPTIELLYKVACGLGISIVDLVNLS
ncbi:MAG: helix-turn-helix domain-containing protein [Candidatus Gastranaerophilales bacterium]|nr:helix-turn-helix domain-containing protein [Candidatus Gastranaerophilales bacterium]